jgi:tetratricopeptide (TPR) repeat protein
MATSPDVYLDRGRLLLEQHRYTDAEKELKQALAMEPENDEALSLLARIKMDTGKPAEALTLIEKALSLDPEEDYYLYLKSFAFYHLNRLEEATKAVNEAIAFNPWQPGYYSLYSFILIQNRHFDLALQKANEGLAIDAEDVNCLNARTQALIKLNRSSEAFETIQNTLAADPENDYSHTNAGFSFLEKGKHKQAAGHFREALRINPANMHARDGMKEALRSKIAPYRWLLQYEYWLQNKGKNMRVIFVLGLFFGIRFLLAAATSVPKPLAILIYIIFGLYLLMVIVSWLIKPIANLFLTFHPEGKYAVTESEKIISYTVISSLLAGIVCFVVYSLTPDDDGKWIMTGFLFASLALPFSYIRYPLSNFSKSTKQWIGLSTIFLGVLAITGTAIMPLLGFGAAMVVIYGPVWVIGTWVAAFSK